MSARCTRIAFALMVLAFTVGIVSVAVRWETGKVFQVVTILVAFLVLSAGAFLFEER